jgi:uncharacterized membrane protein
VNIEITPQLGLILIFVTVLLIMLSASAVFCRKAQVTENAGYLLLTVFSIILTVMSLIFTIITVVAYLNCLSG